MIRVERVSINGTLKGTVHASERIEIHPRARVTADLHAPVLRIEEGAYFQGTCDMSGEAAPKLLEMPAHAQVTAAARIKRKSSVRVEGRIEAATRASVSADADRCVTRPTLDSRLSTPPVLFIRGSA